MTELTVPSTVRTITGVVDTRALVDVMARRLPAGGMAAPRIGGDHHLARVTWRLLDSRILAAAAELLDVDALRPIASGLADYERVRDAADRTTEAADSPEATVALLAPQVLTASHEESVQIAVDGRPVAAPVRFCLDVTAKLAGCSVVVRLGQITELACQVLTLSASLQLIGWTPPLWQSPDVSLPDVHLTLAPPVPVPRVPRPRPSSEDAPRRISDRPPVPGSA